MMLVKDNLAKAVVLGIHQIQVDHSAPVAVDALVMEAE